MCFFCMRLVLKIVNPEKQCHTVQLLQASTNAFVLIDSRRKAVEIRIAELVCTFIILFTLRCMFLPSWKSVDSKVENKSDTLYRNLKNELNAIKRTKTNHVETTKLTSNYMFYTRVVDGSQAEFDEEELE